MSEPSPNTSPTPHDQVMQLVPAVYDELRRIAASMLRRPRTGGTPQGLTLQPTALVHETFLRMAAQHTGWADEAHFRAVASIAMRRVLADHVRSRVAAKRGSGRRGLTLHGEILGSGVAFDAACLNQALEELEAASPRVATLVVYRFFGDLSVTDAASRLGISVSTAEADWRFARLWLQKRIQEIQA